MRKDKIKTGWKLTDQQGAKGPPFGPRCQMHGIKREGEAGLVLMFPGNGTMAKKERKMVM